MARMAALESAATDPTMASPGGAEGSVPTMASPGMAKCSLCQEDMPIAEMSTWTSKGKVYGRCRACAAFQARYTRVVQKLPTEQQELMKSLDADEKKKFLSQVKNFMGEKLKCAVQQYAKTCVEKQKTSQVDVRSTLLPEPLLDAKWKDHPDILSNIKRNAVRQWDDVKGCMLYADSEFSVLASEKQTESQTLEMSASAGAPSTSKKFRVVAGPSTGKATKQSKLIEALEATKASAEQHFRKALDAEYAGYIPQAVVDPAEMAIHKVTQVVADLKMSQEEGWSGNLEELFEDTRMASEALKEQATNLKNYIKSAEKVMGKLADKKAKTEESTMVGPSAGGQDSTMAGPSAGGQESTMAGPSAGGQESTRAGGSPAVPKPTRRAVPKLTRRVCMKRPSSVAK